MLSIVNAECRGFFIVKPSVDMLIAVILGFVLLNAVMLGIVLLNVIILIVIIIIGNILMLSGIKLNAIILCVEFITVMLKAVIECRNSV
jgi:hypothetical protein